MAAKTALANALRVSADSDVIFCEEERCFRRRGKQHKYVKGLLPTLRKFFWRNYDYVKVPSTFAKKTGVRGPRHGINRGQYVHEQFRLYFNQKKYVFKKIYQKKHPFVRRGIQKLKLLKLKPIIAELLVYDSVLELATNIDLVCLNATGNIVVVEWKVGMYN